MVGLGGKHIEVILFTGNHQKHIHFQLVEISFCEEQLPMLANNGKCLFSVFYCSQGCPSDQAQYTKGDVSVYPYVLFSECHSSSLSNSLNRKTWSPSVCLSQIFYS